MANLAQVDPALTGPAVLAILRAAAAAAVVLLGGPLPALRAQDMTPRAYVITPVRSNAVTVTNIFNDGNLLFDGTVPITGATGRLDVPALSLYRSLGVFGRSANVTATLPYGVGTFKATVLGAEPSAIAPDCSTPSSASP